MSVFPQRPNEMIETDLQKKKRRKRKRQKLRENKSLISSSCSSDGRAPDVLGPNFGTLAYQERTTSHTKVQSTGCMTIPGSVEGVLVNFKIDTGAKSTFITTETYEAMVDKPVLQPVLNCYVTANGQKLECLGKATMSIVFENSSFEQEVIVGGVKSNLIGEDFIVKYRVVWDHDESCMIIKGQCIPLDVGDERLMSGRVIALETMTVPVGHEAVIKSGLANRAKITHSNFIGVLTLKYLF